MIPKGPVVETTGPFSFLGRAPETGRLLSDLVYTTDNFLIFRMALRTVTTSKTRTIPETNPHVFQFELIAIHHPPLGTATASPAQCARPGSPSSYLVVGGPDTTLAIQSGESIN